MGDPSETPLRYAERDARSFAGVLRRLGGVSPDRIRHIMDADADTARRALVGINADLREAEKGPSALVVYYSGHADADALHLGGTRLPFDELRQLVKGSPASLRLLIVDACRSGGISRVKRGKAAPSYAVSADAAPVTEGFAVLTSSAAGENSQESDRLRSSFFSHHFINGLRGAADRDADRKVTLSEAYEYAFGQTLRSSGRTLNRQHPTYAFDVKGRGGLVLAQLQKSQRAGTLKLREASIYVIHEGREGGPLLAEVSPPKEDAALYLRPGPYFVQQRLPREYREFDVRLEEDSTVDLGALPFRAVEYDRLVRKGGAEKRSAHGLTVMAAARGEVLEGEGASPHVVLGYRLDLPWLTLGLRGRLGSVETAADGGLSTRRRDELGVGLSIERFVDFSWLSLGFGLLVEGALNQQVFDTDRDTPDRESYTAAFGGLFALERHLGAGFGLRLEGGPSTILLEEAVVEEGVQVDSELGSAFVWWAASGITWRF